MKKKIVDTVMGILVLSFFAIFIVACVCVPVCIFYSVKEEMTVEETQPYVKFQDKHSLDWDFIEEGVLLKLAEYKGGSVEDRAYNIVVTLNRVWENPYTNTITNVVLKELYEVEGLTPADYESIIVSEDSQEAMRLVTIERIDETNGSTEYREEQDE